MLGIGAPGKNGLPNMPGEKAVSLRLEPRAWWRDGAPEVGMRGGGGAKSLPGGMADTVMMVGFTSLGDEDVVVGEEADREVDDGRDVLLENGGCVESGRNDECLGENGNGVDSGAMWSLEVFSLGQHASCSLSGFAKK